MILRQYGTSFQEVETNFNPSAMTEVGFQRTRAFSIPVDELESSYQVVESTDLVAEADAEVQKDAEAAVLHNLEEALQSWVDRLAEGQYLVILNGRDDHPKTRERKETRVVDGVNRYHFYWWVDPPLRVAIYGPK